MKDSPCHGCVPPVRYPGCSGKCSRYHEWRERVNEEKETVHRNREKERIFQANKKKWRVYM